MSNQHRRDQRQASVFLVILRVAALSLSTMGVSFYASEKYFASEHRSQKPVQVATTASVAAPVEVPVEQPGEADLLNPNAPITTSTFDQHGVPFMIIAGGQVGTRRSAVRVAVQNIVQETGARAGLNGTFFANASLSGTDNLLIGPSMCGNESAPTFSPFDKRKELTGRPMVLIAANRTRIMPYDPNSLDDEPALRSTIPGLTDAFLGGVWLVHHGIPVTKDDIDKFNIHDAEDPRRRAFFVLMADGRPGVGATTYVTKSSNLARALSSAGVREAVLLDSGFSTSLVEDGKILVTGHTAPGIPSRPVPHAIVLFDTNPNPPAGRLARTNPAPPAGA
jgi:biofilm PGA synthesis lipoprotein PgaB